MTLVVSSKPSHWVNYNAELWLSNQFNVKHVSVFPLLGSSQILQTETVIVYPKIHSSETMECECINITCDSVYWFRTIPNEGSAKFLGRCNNAERVSHGTDVEQARFKLNKRGMSFVLRIINVTHKDAGIYSCLLKDKNNREMWKPGFLLQPGGLYADISSTSLGSVKYQASLWGLHYNILKMCCTMTSWNYIDTCNILLWTMLLQHPQLEAIQGALFHMPVSSSFFHFALVPHADLLLPESIVLLMVRRSTLPQSNTNTYGSWTRRTAWASLNRVVVVVVFLRDVYFKQVYLECSFLW